MAIRTYKKDPSAVLDYPVDWSRWVPEGDSIVSATFTAPAGLTIDDDFLNGAVATVWLSGGTAGQTYRVTCHVVTDDGREDDRSFVVQVEEM